LDDFVRLWRDEIVPAREKYGFRVVTAWTAVEGNEFGWVVAHDGPEGFEAADGSYYGSPERAALSTDPSSLLDGVRTWMVEPVAVEQG
jgi:hypothetical protein